MFLTKSKFLVGMNCPRRFWKAMHGRTGEEKSPLAKHWKVQGVQVRNLAREMFPEAIDLSHPDIHKCSEITKSNLQHRKAIFDAGFQLGRLYARIDVLVPSGEECWDIVEVSSSTSVKAENIYKAAFLKYICSEIGVQIKDCYIMHINNHYVRAGDIQIKELFIKEKVTAEVDSKTDEIMKLILKMIEIMDSPAEPDLKYQYYLSEDCSCEFEKDCWSFLPADNTGTLYGIRKKKVVDLFNQGIYEIKDVPGHYLNDKQLIQKQAIVDGKPYVNSGKIKELLENLKYPLHYFDFETFEESVPRFDKVRPYQKIPFQYSLHIEFEDGNIEHHEFLNREKTDPREEILESMKKAFGNEGSIFVYNASFEKTILKELAEIYPEYEEWVKGIIARIIDLLKPFSSFDYLSPMQGGSCSIKKVLPAITGRGYEELEIGNGEDAAVQYIRATYDDECSEGEREQILNALLQYCGLDTEGMIWIVKELRKLT